MRYDHCEDNTEEEDALTFEVKLRKAISDDSTDKHLYNTAEHGNCCSIQKCLDILVVVYNCLICIKSRILRDEKNADIDKVLTAHERTENL